MISRMDEIFRNKYLLQFRDKAIDFNYKSKKYKFCKFLVCQIIVLILTLKNTLICYYSENNKLSENLASV